jgi:glycosyltransferase involved in cell wall biosynthesis
MKILHITTVHPQNDNRIFYKECQTLKNEGYDISLLIAGEETKNIDGINIVGFKKEKTRLKRFFKTSFLDLISICLKQEADIYHFHDPEIIFAGLFLRLKGKKVIYDIHENNPASILSKPYIKSIYIKKIISNILNYIEQLSSKYFTALVTARPDITERFNHKNIITLRNFPILPNISTLDNKSIIKTKPSIIFVGGMTKIRGLSELIDAFTIDDKYELWLLGPIKDESIKNKITNSKNVKYFGVVDAYEVFGYINQADIGIITFLPVPNHLNTLATKPFEYMACGKPMIMSDFDYWKKTFKDSSLYVDPTNSNEIYNTIDKLMSNKELITKMSILNKQLSIDEYNWEIESQKLIKLYERLLK